MPPNQTYYALAKLEESIKIISLLVKELLILRARLERNKSLKPKAQAIYEDLKREKTKLIHSISATMLALI